MVRSLSSRKPSRINKSRQFFTAVVNRHADLYYWCGDKKGDEIMWYKIFIAICLILAIIMSVGYAKNMQAANKLYWENYYNTVLSSHGEGGHIAHDYHDSAQWNYSWIIWIPDGIKFGMWFFVIPVVVVSVIKIAIKK